MCCYSDSTIYVFCGYKGNPNYSVEKYTADRGWKSLDAAFHYPVYNIAAIPYGEDILIFGGLGVKINEEVKRTMAIFQEEKNRFNELFDVAQTPLYMSCRSYIQVHDEIYVGY